LLQVRYFGINYKDVASIPVGYERQIEMFSLDFEEYLWAIGIDKKAINSVKEYFDKKEKVPIAIHESMIKYIREYITVGGMPEVVKTFVDTSNHKEVYDVQKKIIDSYLDDIYKYASTSEKIKVKNVYLSIPKQLAKANKKFQFSFVEKRTTSRKYENSIEWLRDANLVNYCNNVNNPIIPLSAYIRDNFFKIYLNDIGLLTAMYEYEVKDLIITDKLKGDAKGGIYENLIADNLIKKGFNLFYYKNENNSHEVEFLIIKEGTVVPVEVKSSNGPTISLNEFLKREDVLFGYKFISGNVGVDGKKITLPLYMMLFI